MVKKNGSIGKLCYLASEINVLIDQGLKLSTSDVKTYCEDRTILNEIENILPSYVDVTLMLDEERGEMLNLLQHEAVKTENHSNNGLSLLMGYILDLINDETKRFNQHPRSIRWGWRVDSFERVQD